MKVFDHWFLPENKQTEEMMRILRRDKELGEKNKPQIDFYV
jgi:hypothetical protein